MSQQRFFPPPEARTLAEIADHIGAQVHRGDGNLKISNVAPLDLAASGDISFIDNPRYLDHLAETRATACLAPKKFVDRVPENTAIILCQAPYLAFAETLKLFYPDGFQLTGLYGEGRLHDTAVVHPSAQLEDGVIVEPGAVIGAEAKIGSGSVIGANTVIGHHVCIGRQCYIGANVTIQHALIGDRVNIHPGTRIGQDGYGFAMTPFGHRKVPQIGRVIIQDDVEIGANTTIDRGAIRDTLIGEGTKIDNQVQIGHNVEIGRHCLLVAQAGISGSTKLEDFVVLAGKVGLSGHLTIGKGAQIAGGANVADDIPPGEKWAGTPARPIRQFMREDRKLRSLVAQRQSDTGRDGSK